MDLKVKMVELDIFIKAWLGRIYLIRWQDL